ncbi:hypothetical protein [Undibacter mobilis]|uniref:Uncharacterized protein n=1 Tax=Undibacter mobilis TaxID=2292256 RepID=A0A371B8X9_9BRAD|nr:hypothetical protein [Undibacter mobilis]RDV04059.1 hypothetical protein DXH78_05340 [Undibacter mobilis]
MAKKRTKKLKTKTRAKKKTRTTAARSVKRPLSKKTKKSAKKKTVRKLKKKAASRKPSPRQALIERELEEGLIETFPASDPVALTDPTTTIKD